MQGKKKSLVPAKLNVFLKIIGKRDDGYHEIRSGITFINLFDQIEIEIIKNFKSTISYSGEFAPKQGNFDDCIIMRTLDFVNFKKNTHLKIDIIKNIPVQGGLGSASANAASLIRTLNEMDLIEYRKPEHYAILGADIPCFLFNKDCLVTGMGDKVVYHSFPKYFFLLVKPNFNNSTKYLYSKFKSKKIYDDNEILSKDFKINEEDSGNEFEKIIFEEKPESLKIKDFLDNLDKVIFSRMTGTGSCFYAVFEKTDYAYNAQKIFNSKFPNLWSCICENNF